MNGMETQERTVPQIELRGLSKVYQIPGGEVQALNNINLTIEQGDIYGIIGMSGAGKSTLIRLMNGLEKASDEYLQERVLRLAQLRSGADMFERRLLRSHPNLRSKRHGKLIDVLRQKKDGVVKK